MSDDEAQVPLSGGRSRDSVIRVGNTVRRDPRPETNTIHAFLRHLEAVGFPGAPRALGYDEHGREVLSYIDGEAGTRAEHGAAPAFVRSDASLRSFGSLLRQYHDATASFVPPPTAHWMQQVGHPTSGDVICHNDLGPYNTVFVEQLPVGLIDFDDAAPGSRDWDLAYAAYRWVPFYPDEVCMLPVNGWTRPPDRVRRLALFCDGYGWPDPGSLMPVMVTRISAMMATGIARNESGAHRYAAEWKATMLPRLERDRTFVARWVEPAAPPMAR